jgi:hypothetical protein
LLKSDILGWNGRRRVSATAVERGDADVDVVLVLRHIDVEAAEVAALAAVSQPAVQVKV